MARDCPTEAILARMLEDRLGPSEAGPVEAHVATCRACQAALERLTDLAPAKTESVWVDPTGRPARAPGASWSTRSGGPDEPEATRDGGPRGDEPPESPEIPGYRVDRELGRGGMGVVYLARQVHANRMVALKMVLNGRARPEDLIRFRVEGESLARLHHPNIVQVYDVGDHNGRPFFSMEYVEGENLAEALRGEPRPPRQAALLVEALARGAHAAHQCGVVHRDLKPANILMSVGRPRDGVDPSDPPVPKITDFGLAKHVGSDSGLTHTGQILGTPSYMAPEQAQGGANVGVPADVYALGAILYEVLTGRPPFKGATAWDTMMQGVHEPVTPPSRHRPGVPRDLEVICLKALAKAAAGRYASADAMAEDLRRFGAGEPILARRAPAWEVAWKWALRRPAAALGAATLLAALVALVGVVLAYNARLVAASSRADLAARDADAGRALALRALDRLTVEVQETLRDAPSTRPLRRKLLGTAIEGLREVTAGLDPAALDIRRASAHRKLGDLHRQVGQADEAREQYRACILDAEGLLARRPDDSEAMGCLVGACVQLGEMHLLQDQRAPAKALLTRAVSMAEARVGLDPSGEDARLDRLVAYRRLGHARLWCRELPEARVAFERLRDLASGRIASGGADGRVHAALADAEVFLGDVDKEAANLEGFREHYRVAIAIARGLVEAEPSARRHKIMLCVALHNLAEEAIERFDLDEAAPPLDEVGKLLAEASAADPDDVDLRLKLAEARWTRARSDLDRGRFAEAAGRFGAIRDDLGVLKAAGKLQGSAFGLDLVEQATSEVKHCDDLARGAEDPDYVRARTGPFRFLLMAGRVVAHLAADPPRGPEAAAEADELAAIDPAAAGGPAAAVDLARGLAWAAAALEKAPDFPGKAEARSRSASRGLAALKFALDHDYADFARLIRDDAAPLRRLEGYRPLARAAGDRARARKAAKAAK